MIEIGRRELLKASSLLVVSTALPAFALAAPSLPAFYEEIEQRTFQWFWDTANRKNGLVPDRWPTPSFCSTAVRRAP